MSDGLEQQIIKLEKQLIKVDGVLDHLISNQDKLVNSHESLTKSMNDIAIALNNLSIFEEGTKESFSRVHNRIDDIEKKLNTFKEDMSIVSTLVKRPILIAFISVGFYVLTFTDLLKVGGN